MLQIANALVKLNGGRGCVTDMTVFSPAVFSGNVVGPVYTVRVRVAKANMDRAWADWADGPRERYNQSATPAAFRPLYPRHAPMNVTDEVCRSTAVHPMQS